MVRDAGWPGVQRVSSYVYLGGTVNSTNLDFLLSSVPLSCALLSSLSCVFTRRISRLFDLQRIRLLALFPVCVANKRLRTFEGSNALRRDRPAHMCPAYATSETKH